LEDLESTVELNYDALDGRVTKLEKNAKEQAEMNELVRDRFERVVVAFDKIMDENHSLRKLAAGLVFITAGLVIEMVKTKTQIREIKNVMNEG
jgi:hypothetical protein